MNQSLTFAIRAIETADDDANVSPLRAYCIQEMKMPEARLQELIDRPGPTDAGRIDQVFRHLAAIEKDKKRKAAKKTSKKKTGS